MDQALKKRLDECKQILNEADKPLSTTKKPMAQHMWVISKDSAGGYLITIGDPKKTSSSIKQRFSGSAAKDELQHWVKYEMPRKVSQDHIVDITGLGLVPEFYTQWYVDNMM